MALLTIVCLCFTPLKAHPDDRYFSYSVSAGGGLYSVGDLVHWNTSASVIGSDISGIKALSCSLIESRGEAMSGPLSASFFVPYYGSVTNCVPENYHDVPGTGKVTTTFKYTNKFSSGGSGGAGSVGLGAGQFVKKEGIMGGSLCESSYTLTKTGFHVLGMYHGSGSVWVSGKKDAEEVTESESSSTGFYVTKIPAPTLGTLSAAFFSDILSRLGKDGCQEANGFCAGADANRDGRVDLVDVQLLLDQGGSNIDVAADVYQAADLTEDDRVNLRDYAVLVAHWLRSDCGRANLWCHGADFDRSGAVDEDDLAYLAHRWLKPVPPAFVPDPLAVDFTLSPCLLRALAESWLSE